MHSSVTPNASRLSCGALKKDSFLNLRAPASFKRLLGSRRLRATGRRLRTALNEIVQANTKEEHREDKASDLPTGIRAGATDPMPGDDL